MKQRLDQELFLRKMVDSRSQAESYIRLGLVTVNGRAVTKPGFFVDSEQADIQLHVHEQYVSRAALKLDSVAAILRLDFRNKTMLDVGSSTGGFTDYALRHGAKKVIAVEVGKDQLHPRLRQDTRIELHEQTDIRELDSLTEVPGIVVIDVSFVSLREILPHLLRFCDPSTEVIAMVKPQFEAQLNFFKHKGVIKNDHMRREILKAFEAWVTSRYTIVDKADSTVAGAKGNRERFYKLYPTHKALGY